MQCNAEGNSLYFLRLDKIDKQKYAIKENFKINIK